MKPIKHAEASAKVFGGKPKDYLKIHEWFDQFRFCIADPRHRMFLHHSAGVIICEQVFGKKIKNSEGKKVTVRDIAEHHITMDVGEMRTPQDWLDNIHNEEWVKPKKSKIETLVEKASKKEDDSEDEISKLKKKVKELELQVEEAKAPFQRFD